MLYLLIIVRYISHIEIILWCLDSHKIRYISIICFKKVILSVADDWHHCFRSVLLEKSKFVSVENKSYLKITY